MNTGRRGMYCFAPHGGWYDRQLTKNVGVIPYIFHKEYGFRSVMVTSRGGPYPSLDTYVKGLEMAKMDALADSARETMLREGKELVALLTELYPFLASIEAKACASRFYEALIDWHLGNGKSGHVQRRFSLLREELLRYHDIPAIQFTDKETEWDN